MRRILPIVFVIIAASVGAVMAYALLSPGAPPAAAPEPRSRVVLVALASPPGTGWASVSSLSAAAAGPGTIVVVPDMLVSPQAAGVLRSILARGAVLVVYGGHSLEALNTVAARMGLTLQVPRARSAGGERIVALAVYAEPTAKGSLVPHYFFFWGRSAADAPLRLVVAKVAAWHAAAEAENSAGQAAQPLQAADPVLDDYTYRLSGTITDYATVYCSLSGSWSAVDAAVGSSTLKIHVDYAYEKDSRHPGLYLWRIAAKEAVSVFNSYSSDFALPAILLDWWVGTPERIAVKAASLPDEALADYWVSTGTKGPKTNIIRFLDAVGAPETLRLLVGSDIYAEPRVTDYGWSSYWSSYVEKAVEWRWAESLPSLGFARNGEADALAYFDAIEPFVGTVNVTSSLRYVGLDPGMAGKSCATWRSYDIEAHTYGLDYTARR